jgi:hypothetical protein
MSFFVTTFPSSKEYPPRDDIVSIIEAAGGHCVEAPQTADLLIGCPEVLKSKARPVKEIDKAGRASAPKHVLLPKFVFDAVSRKELRYHKEYFIE